MTYEMFMDYLMSREKANPYVGRQRWGTIAGPTTNTLQSLEEFQIQWETAMGRCNDLSQEETNAGLINKLHPKMKQMIEEKEKKMHRWEFWVNWAGRRIEKDKLFDLIKESVGLKTVFKYDYTSNLTMVKFSSADEQTNCGCPTPSKTCQLAWPGVPPCGVLSWPSPTTPQFVFSSISYDLILISGRHCGQVKDLLNWCKPTPPRGRTKNFASESAMRCK